MITIPLDNIKTRLQTQTFYQDSRKDMDKIKSLKMKTQTTDNVNLLNVAARPFVSNNIAKGVVEEVLHPTERKIKYHDILSTIKTILKEEGAKGFVKGVVPRILTHAPSSAVSWTAYEMIKKFLHKHSQH